MFTHVTVGLLYAYIHMCVCVCVYNIITTHRSPNVNIICETNRIARVDVVFGCVLACIYRHGRTRRKPKSRRLTLVTRASIKPRLRCGIGVAILDLDRLRCRRITRFVRRVLSIRLVAVAFTRVLSRLLSAVFLVTRTYLAGETLA